MADQPEIDAEAWLDACRRMVDGQREIFAEVSGITARTEYEGIGEGGDHTLVIDRRCEDVAFTELRRMHDEGHEFVAVSEERGEVDVRQLPRGARRDRPHRRVAQRTPDDPASQP